MSRRAPSATFRFPTRRRLVPIERRAACRALVRTLRTGFGSLSSVAPSLSAACAEVLFRLPPRCTVLACERRALEEGARRFIPHSGGRLATWTFGSGLPIVTLHGWGGHAARLSPFFAPIVDAGFSVIAFDAPGHGESSGALSSLPDFVAALETIAREVGPLAGAVGHSAGAAATALAIRRGIEIPRVVMLAPPSDPESFAARFAHHMGIPAAVREAMKRRLETRYGIGWTDLKLSAPARVSGDLLVIHDRNDGRVPWKQGAAIAAGWPGARMVSTRGLGHHKILRDANVVATAVRFLTARRRIAGPAASEVAAAV